MGHRSPEPQGTLSLLVERFVRTPAASVAPRGVLLPYSVRMEAGPSVRRTPWSSRRWLLGAVERFTKRRVPRLRFVGGGAQSDLWCQVMADVLDRPIQTVAMPIQANTRGAAILAGIALKRMTVDDAARQVEVARTYRPDPALRGTYDELYGDFRTIHKKTKGIAAR